MAERGHWNRAGRRAGGKRPARIYVPTLTSDELKIMQQREQVRREFGEEGVAAFDAILEARAKKEAEDGD